MSNIKLSINPNSCKLFICLFCPLFLIPISLLLLASYWAYSAESHHDHQLLKQQQQHNLTLLENHFNHELKSVITDLKFLSKQNELNNLLKQQVEAKTNLAHEFQSFSQFKRKYDQIRFINLAGQEQVRVNLNQDHAIVIPEPQLQDKSDRYYFTETLSLAKEQVFLSAFDLNIENGTIEIPIKPVIRLATPIFNTDKQVSGIVILNYLGQYLLTPLADSADSPSHNFLINQQGFWLKGVKPAEEWGHMYPDRQSKTMDKHFPNAWKQIQTGTSGQFHTDSGFFSYTTIYPLSSSPLLAKNPSLVWKLVSYIPQQVFTAHTSRLRQRFIIFDIVLALFWLASCTFITRSKRQRDLAHKQILERDEQLINIFSTAFDSIITINERGIIETFNPAACRMFGYQEHQALGNKINMLMSSPHKEFHDTYLQHFIETEQAKIIGKPTQVMALHKDGTEFSVDLCIGAKKIKQQWVFTGIIRDAAPVQQLKKQLLETSQHDDFLEACYNRQYFYQYLQESCNRALLTNTSLSIILIDIINFHQINDQYGYQAGDSYLQSISTFLVDIIGEAGSLARYADNTFIILLPECGAEDAQKSAEQIKDEIESYQLSFQDQEINRKAIAGTATLQDPVISNASQLIHTADKSLASNKQSGRL